MLTAVSTHRLTAGVSLHRFSGSADTTGAIRPSQFIGVQLPEDLDPIGGPRSLSALDRYLYFTPCQISSGSVALLAKHGRVTGLLGLPRPTGPLQIRVAEIDGGFDVIPPSTVCIAGGTGIACFTALQELDVGGRLICTIRGDDFELLPALLQNHILRADAWREIRVFISSGGETTTIAGRRMDWWKQYLAGLELPVNISCSLGRMTQQDLPEASSPGATILFCGSASLEWQIKMWSLNGAAVYTTRRT